MEEFQHEPRVVEALQRNLEIERVVYYGLELRRGDSVGEKRAHNHKAHLPQRHLLDIAEQGLRQLRQAVGHIETAVRSYSVGYGLGETDFRRNPVGAVQNHTTKLTNRCHISNPNFPFWLRLLFVVSAISSDCCCYALHNR